MSLIVKFNFDFDMRKAFFVESKKITICLSKYYIKPQYLKQFSRIFREISFTPLDLKFSSFLLIYPILNLHIHYEMIPNKLFSTPKYPNPFSLYK